MITDFCLEPVCFCYLRGMKHCLGTLGLRVTVCREMWGNYWTSFVLNVKVGFGNRCMNNTTACHSSFLSLTAATAFISLFLRSLLHLSFIWPPLSSQISCLQSFFVSVHLFIFLSLHVFLSLCCLCGCVATSFLSLKDLLISHRKHNCLSPFPCLHLPFCSVSLNLVLSFVLTVYGIFGKATL